jgi:predicted Zn-dependent protease with MMP-like domain
VPQTIHRRGNPARLRRLRCAATLRFSPNEGYGSVTGVGRSDAYADLWMRDAYDARADVDFEQVVGEAVDSLPPDLRRAMSNVELVVEGEPPDGAPLLGLYQGIPLTRRTSRYGGVLPDKITIYRGPLERLYGGDRERLRNQIRHVVLHEIAHHFGISDERLIELDRY